MDNKQLVHIASEMLIIGGVTHYFNSKCKDLERKVISLTQYCEAQNSRLQDLERIVFGKVHYLPRAEKETVNKQSTQKNIEVKNKDVQMERKQEVTERKQEVTNLEDEEELISDADIEKELQELNEQKQESTTVELVDDDEVEFINPEQFKTVAKKNK